MAEAVDITTMSPLRVATIAVKPHLAGADLSEVDKVLVAGGIARAVLDALAAAGYVVAPAVAEGETGG